MNEATRTIVFVVVAGVSVAAASLTHLATQPKDFGDDVNIGQPFYPDFDPAEAAMLQVVAYDEDTATARDFQVAFVDGRWVIPSHHKYPADAKDRLEKTAASVVGIKREALASRYESAQEQYGVIRPDDPSSESLTGRGQQLTIKDKDGNVLADYIIGKKVETEGDEDAYYVRLPGEKFTYIARLDIDLSTRFADWIEADLLQLDRDDLTELLVDKYTVREQLRVDGGQAVMFRELDQRERNRLTREKWSDPWKLDGLNDQTEEVNSDNVREMVNDLDDLKIVGVRPKPRGIGGDLSIDRDYVKSQTQLQLLQEELESKGFFVIVDPDQPAVSEDQRPKFRLAARHGELLAGTNEGVVYTLRFGELFTGSEFDIEVGFGSKKDKQGETKESADAAEKTEAADKEAKKDQGPEDANGEADPKDADSGNTEDSEEESKDSDLKKSRYLFVSVHFDESLIPDKPLKPTEPQKPAELDATTDEKDSGDADSKEKADGDSTDEANESEEATEPTKADGGESDAESTGADEADSKTEAEPKDSDAPADDADEQKPDAQKEYDEAKKKYEQDLKTYEDDLKGYNRKVEDGQKRVEELTERFAGWYYVISGESFENLRLSRSELVKPKEKADDDSTDDAGGEEPVVAPKPESDAADAPAATDSDDSDTQPPSNE